MIYGLQIFNESKKLIFDSSISSGGVFLGIFNVPKDGAVYTFKSMKGFSNGFAINLYGGSGASGMSYDNLLGYPRFVFNDLNWGEKLRYW
ncbi:hypothetical protein [Janthinobacterium lividum]|uniref:hypothetical protein n=1 Tax=Janthinobacterium lividum TaxID=29581 RepID=UPI000FE1D167|nr:hypothetical protein [Janthinobacterium lividum]